MPPIRNPFNHYWRKKNGSVHHSGREREFPADDPEYQAWLAEGHTPSQYPVDQFGKESRDCMFNIVNPWRLTVLPMNEFGAVEDDAIRQEAEERWAIIRERVCDPDLGGKGIHDRETIEKLWLYMDSWKLYRKKPKPILY